VCVCEDTLKRSLRGHPVCVCVCEVTYAVCERKSTRSRKLGLGCGELFMSIQYNIQNKHINIYSCYIFAL